MKKRVLIVEDEADILDLVTLHLCRAGYETESTTDGEKAIEALKLSGFDILILDWMLPGMSGLEIALRVRSGQGGLKIAKDTPILMLTAKAESDDIVAGLEAGADDYLTKPFETGVMIARVKALLRRAERKGQLQIQAEVRVGSVTLKPELHEAYCSGEKLALTLSEYKLLKALVDQEGRVLTRQQLVSFVQGEGITVTPRTVDTHVFGLRKKLGECSSIIETIRGVGYRVVSDSGY